MTDEKQEPFTLPFTTNQLLSTMARLAASDGHTMAVAILATCENLRLQKKSYRHLKKSNYKLIIHFQLPIWIYKQVERYKDDHYWGDPEYSAPEWTLQHYANNALKSYPECEVEEINLAPSFTDDTDWRDKAIAWLSGQGVSNQGRVRSDNLPSRTSDGLLFRSEPEILLYKALKACGVSFAPLPVFIRGGETYQRIEPDFVILKDGIVLVVEVDGDTFHRETPAEAHARTTMLGHEGAMIERIRAADCDTPEKAEAVASRLLTVIEKLKKSQ